MNLRCIREAYTAQLKTNISGNLKFYQQDEPWLSNYFEQDNWFLDTNISIENVELLEPEGPHKYDLENTRLLFDALKHLKVSQAIDERLWVYLTHETFWKYMRVRWAVGNQKDPVRFIRERYFFMPDKGRALIRNGISRLWWYGYITYDDNRADPYELTKTLLCKQDIAQQLLERNFSRSIKITKAVLSVLTELEKINKPLPDREQFRDLMKYINLLGGISVLDALDQSELEKIVIKKLENTA
ncbi:MAG: hypothetical protein PWP66_280 [Thermosediminibacterales bacterium]|nr:hypothetical protein [Thermosediminibacterales bacterium]